VGVKCSKAITRSEITRGFRVSENLLPIEIKEGNTVRSFRKEVVRKGLLESV